MAMLVAPRVLSFRLVVSLKKEELMRAVLTASDATLLPATSGQRKYTFYQIDH